MRFLCPSCKAKYQIGDDKVAGRPVRMKCRKCGYVIQISSVPGMGDALIPPVPPTKETSRVSSAAGSEPPLGDFRLGEFDLAVLRLLGHPRARSLEVPLSPTSGMGRSGRYAIIGELGSGSQAETLDA